MHTESYRIEPARSTTAISSPRNNKHRLFSRQASHYSCVAAPSFQPAIRIPDFDTVNSDLRQQLVCLSHKHEKNLSVIHKLSQSGIVYDQAKQNNLLVSGQYILPILHRSEKKCFKQCYIILAIAITLYIGIEMFSELQWQTFLECVYYHQALLVYNP